MFARTSTIALFSMIPLLAAATAVPRTTTPTTPASQCNTGDLQCCNSTQESSNTNAAVTTLLGLLGVVIGDLTGQVGVTCSPSASLASVEILALRNQSAAPTIHSMALLHWAAPP
ncbi:hypothetical protein BD779DRAFT_1668511 [Infundibulicybe gibba]|nr:hypothetical protein BD779DRAFT_1668511 [Infundibulicybe gibba]